MSGVIGVLGLFLALAVLAYLTAVRNWSILPSALIASMVIIITNGLPIWETFLESFSGGLSGYIKSFFIMMALSSLFGKVMSDSGAAEAIAQKFVKVFGVKHIGLALLIIGGLITYGGINGVVAIFTIYPLGIALIREANLPRQYLLGAAGAGCGSYAMLALPGTPQSQNLIPTTFLGTDAYAAPVMSIISSAAMFVASIFFLEFLERRYRRKEMGFVPGIHEQTANGQVRLPRDPATLPHWGLSLIPFVCVFGIILALKNVVAAVGGACAALAVATLVCYLMNMKRFDSNLNILVKDGMQSGIIAVCSVAAIVGFGTVVQAAPAFQVFVDWCMNLNFSPYINMTIATNCFAAMTGSSAGGLTMFMQTMAQRYVEAGINPEIIHRLNAVACSGLDTVPWSGAVVTYLAACGLSHREGYLTLIGSSVFVPAVGTLACLVCAFLGIA